MTLTDMIVCTTMTYSLSKSRTGFSATNVMVTKCIRVILETDILCAIFSIMHMVFFVTTASSTHYHLAASLTVSKLYSNSVLAVSRHLQYTLIYFLKSHHSFLTLVSALSVDGT